jgi:hypothetical protein
MMVVTADDRSQTIREFCATERFSIATYYKLKRLGLGPAEMIVPGTRIVRITPKARAEWHARMQQRSEHQNVELESRRRQAAEAGRIAAASPSHVSRRGRSADRTGPAMAGRAPSTTGDDSRGKGRRLP